MTRTPEEERAHNVRTYIDTTVAETGMLCLRFLLTDLDNKSESYLQKGQEIPDALAERAKILNTAVLEIAKIKEENTKED